MAVAQAVSTAGTQTCVYNDSADVAKELAMKVFKDRLVHSGHVDLPPCLVTMSSGKSSSTSSTGREGSRRSSAAPRLHRVMLGVCRQVRKEYETLFKDMIEQLSPTPRTSYVQFLGFASELFQDGVTYGKIVSLYVFCAELANFYMSNLEMGPGFVASVVSWHGRCFRDVIQKWLDERGSWVSSTLSSLYYKY